MKVEKNVLINNDESDDSDDECVIQMMQNMKMKNTELGNVKDFEVSDDDDPTLYWII